MSLFTDLNDTKTILNWTGTVLTWVYLPLNIFAMFLMDTPASITIPGILSGLVLYHILFKRVDFTIDIPISCSKKDH